MCWVASMMMNSTARRPGMEKEKKRNMDTMDAATRPVHHHAAIVAQHARMEAWMGLVKGT